MKVKIAAALAAWPLIAIAAPALAQDWAFRAGQGAAGSLAEGELAGVVLRCREGVQELHLTHNAAAFDHERTHTIVLSVDGTAFPFEARAQPSERTGDDDFVAMTDTAALAPLLAALAKGKAVEVSAPSGRYTLGLSGSSAALSAFARACPAPV
jgi:hypothetical protein